MKIKNLWLSLSLVLVAVCAQAADVKPYIPRDDMPNGVNFLVTPPDTTSSQFVYDISQYMWGKSMRKDSARAALAVAQAVTEPADMAKLFSGPFGMEISAKKTPAIMHVLERGVKTLNLTSRKPKNHFMRKRPYARFNEPTLVPSDEEELRTNGSYPSGHTIRGYSMALLLIQINPGAQDALLKYAYEWGQSRVIAGFHWQSDVDASKMVVAGAFARLQVSAEFQADMKKAQEEFKKLKKK